MSSPESATDSIKTLSAVGGQLAVHEQLFKNPEEFFSTLKNGFSQIAKENPDGTKAQSISIDGLLNYIANGQDENLKKAAVVAVDHYGEFLKMDGDIWGAHSDGISSRDLDRDLALQKAGASAMIAAAETKAVLTSALRLVETPILALGTAIATTAAPIVAAPLTVLMGACTAYTGFSFLSNASDAIHIPSVASYRQNTPKTWKEINSTTPFR